MFSIKNIERFIELRFDRGRLRRSFLYTPYKIFKSLRFIFDGRIYNLLSREVFVTRLSNPNVDCYSQWLSSFQMEPETLPKQFDESTVPWMYIKAVHFLEFYIHRNNCEIYFEYGSGGSAFFFSHLAAKVVSVEHDEQYYHYIKKLLAGVENIDLQLVVPEKDGSNYVQTIDQFADGSIDLIIIDGVFRNECLLKSCSKVSDNGLIVLDNSTRDDYATVVGKMKRDFESITVHGGTTYAQGEDATTIFWKKKR